MTLPSWLASAKPVSMLLFLLGSASAAEVPAQTGSGVTSATATVRTSTRPEQGKLSEVAPAHPLLSVLDYARKEQAYLRQTVRDFSCRLVKRERIDDILQDYQYINMWVREEARSGNRRVTPLSIYLEFLAPKNVSGRRVLFVDGQNDGKLLVRNGGKHFDYVVAKIDPYGDSAKDESLVPVTQSGFNQILARMIQILEQHATVDPSGEYTQVKRISGAKLNQRPCQVIRITHAEKQPGLEFHIANVYVDDELHAPVRVDYSEWPTRTGETPPLLAEYTYTDLKMNVGLNDQSFDPKLLRSRARYDSRAAK
jgi:hypothetical protein